MTLLHIDASILNDQSASRRLTAAIVKRLTEARPGIRVIRTDLAAEPVDHLSTAEFLAFQGVQPEDDATKGAVARNARLLEDFLAADIVVVGAPMYNFGVPSQLKAWIDRLAVAGKTFRYTEKGAEGLAGGKKVIVASSRGGFYGPQTPIAFLDHQETYLRNIFGFFGITDITFVRAEGLALGEDARKSAIASAEAQVEKLAA
ncbi:MAG: FMN-dependent NADH-azoreductase [Burkholderiaceae bacterium]